MKRIFNTKAIRAVLLAVLLLSLISLVACTEKNAPYEWAWGGDGDIIWNEDRTYYRYELPLGYKLRFTTKYQFDEYVYYDDGYYDYERLYSYARDGEILTTSDDDEYFCYVTDKGRQIINELIDGNQARMTVFKDNKESELHPLILPQLDSLDMGREFEVNDIKTARRYDIRKYDATGSVYHVCGAIYRIGGGMWYVNYDRLSNDRFDADGDFSYRSGTVTMYSVEQDSSLKVHFGGIDEMLERIEYKIVYEDEDINPKPERKKMDPEVRAKVTFWITYSLLAFALPAWPLVIGLKNARSRKHGYGRHWFILSIGAGVWVAIGALIASLFI